MDDSKPLNLTIPSTSSSSSSLSRSQKKRASRQKLIKIRNGEFMKNHPNMANPFLIQEILKSGRKYIKDSKKCSEKILRINKDQEETIVMLKKAKRHKKTDLRVDLTNKLNELEEARVMQVSKRLKLIETGLRRMKSLDLETCNLPNDIREKLQKERIQIIRALPHA